MYIMVFKNSVKSYKNVGYSASLREVHALQNHSSSKGSLGLGDPGVRNGFMQHLWLYTSMYNAIGSIKHTKCPNSGSISRPDTSRNYKNPLKICPYNDYLMMRQVLTLA